MLDTIPKPKIPIIEIKEDSDAISIDDVEQPVQNTDKLDPKIEEAFAGILGFMCAMGLPEDIFAQKQEFYKEQAVNLGVVENIWTVIKTYYPEAEMSPAVALAVSLSIFCIVVYSDRKQTMAEYNKKKRAEELRQQAAHIKLAKLKDNKPKQKIEENKKGDEK